MKVAFIDRDGVINKDIGYLSKWKDFKYEPNIIDGLKRLIKKKFNLIMITNQGGVAKGLIKEEEVFKIHKYLLDDLARHKISFLDIKICFHHPDGIVKKYNLNCMCRKPSPKMILDASLEHKINLEKSVLIGDRITDVEAGKNAGVDLCVGVYGKYFKKNKIYPFPVFNNLNEFSKTL